MKVAATLLALVGSAAAFAPAQQSSASSALADAKPFSGELGAMTPVSSSVRYQDVDRI
jgi:hypothetical protein